MTKKFWLNLFLTGRTQSVTPISLGEPGFTMCPFPRVPRYFHSYFTVCSNDTQIELTTFDSKSFAGNMMTFNVHVYCKSCHRESTLKLIRAFSEKVVQERGTCPSCTNRGNLVYVSSIGKR